MLSLFRNSNMVRNVYFRFVLYLSFLYNVSLETTLIVQKVSTGYNMTCTGNTNSTLTWIGYENNFDLISELKENPYKGSNVKLRNSYNFNLPFVLDWRWKGFRTDSYQCDNIGIIAADISEIKTLTFSIRFKGLVKLILIDVRGKYHEAILDENVTQKAFSVNIEYVDHQCQYLQPENPWRHYSLYASEGKYFVSKYKQKNVTKFGIVSLKIQAMQSFLELKAHIYSVAALSNLTISNGIDICRSIFYYTQRTSTMQINNRTINMQGMNTWNEIKIEGRYLHIVSNYQIFINIVNCNNERSDRINFNNTKLTGCQNLEDGFSLTVSKPKLQNHTDNICQNYPDLCNKHLVCRHVGCYCPGHYTGDFCEKDCPKNCKDGICNSITGKCISGCKNNFQGDTCNECFPFYWGQSCEQVCGNGCAGKVCSKQTGRCNNGCKDGYSGQNCEKCSDHRWGSKCQNDCSQGCSNMCDVINGQCKCKNRYSGEKCEECMPLYWGKNCEQTCEGCEERCSKDTGLCERGCKIGYIGPNCKKCPDFSWGKDCQNTCERGCSDTCNFANGHCKCRNGYYGVKCKVYAYLHEEPKLIETGPDWIKLQINTSEIISINNAIKIFEQGTPSIVQKKEDLFKIINLNPGTRYEFEVMVCYRSNCSITSVENPKINAITCADVDESVIEIETSSDYIIINTLQYDNYCAHKYYKLNYQMNNQTVEVPLNISTKIQSLTPYTNYVIKILRQKKVIYEKIVQTEESGPSAPTNLSVDDDLIVWNAPKLPNGLLKKFKIFINRQYIDEVPYTNSIDTYLYKLKDLSPSTKYDISVQAVNSFEGEEAKLLISTKPPTPEVTSLSTSNCNSNFCDVELLLGNTFNSTIYEAYKFMENCEGNIIQHQTLGEKNIISLFGLHKNSTICIENNFLGKKAFCKIMVSAKTYETKHAQLYYLLFLIIIPITFVVFIVFRSRSKKINNDVSEQERLVAYSPIDPLKLHEENTDINRNLIGQYLKNLVNGQGGPNVLDTEFENICTKKGEAMVGILEINSMKNRYKNIVPYDATRVILNETSEDYINASYIQGYNGDKTYIATQCPKLITENDFWLMIWQENVEIIVMLSTLSEGPNKMCQYWPNDLSSKEYRKFKVTHLETEQRTDFVIRTFIISQENFDRKIRQINYTTWPDQKIPIFPLSLIDFINYVQLINHRNTAPIVVHCSAGIGRTGVYIMCDHYLNTKDEIINIPKKLEALRNNRSLVQTALQYRFIYFIVDEMTNMDVTKNVSLELIKMCNKTIIQELVSHDLEYIKERLYLNKLLYNTMKPIHDELTANRNPRIRAVSESTIILSRTKDVDSIYINAVYVHGYEQANKFISTQIPLPSTLRDFWRMVYEKEPAVIIVLQDVCYPNDVSVFQFWPSIFHPKGKKVLEVTTFIEVALENEYDEEFYTIYDLKILNTKFNNEVKTKLFTFRAWTCEKKVPNSIESFLTLYNNVSKLTSHKSKTMLCCYDSAVGCGLYIAFDLLVKRIKYDKIFNICWAVRSIRRFRDEFVNSKEQLIFLYQVANYYINHYQSELHDYVNAPPSDKDYIDEIYENIFQDLNAIKM